MAAFADISLPFQHDPRVLMKYITALVNLGYETVAINRTISPEIKPKGGQDKIPGPPNLTNLQGLNGLKKVCPKLKLLSRITVVIQDQQQVRFIPGDTVQSYDIVSVQPMNEKLFQQVCQAVECDVISFDMTSRMPFYIKHPQINLAIERGISFEILYAPAIRDEGLRKHIITNALELTRVSKGRNVVISSGAERTIELRGPYDLINLGILFGLKPDQSKAAVSKNIRSIIYHAQARNKTVKGVVSLEKMPISSGVKRASENIEYGKETDVTAKKLKV